MIESPPKIPPLNEVSDELRDYLRGVDNFLQRVYKKVKNFDLGDVTIFSGDSVPASSLGQDGDIYVRVNGASTSFYQNINGTWTLNS